MQVIGTVRSRNGWFDATDLPAGRRHPGLTGKGN